MGGSQEIDFPSDISASHAFVAVVRGFGQKQLYWLCLAMAAVEPGYGTGQQAIRVLSRHHFQRVIDAMPLPAFELKPEPGQVPDATVQRVERRRVLHPTRLADGRLPGKKKEQSKNTIGYKNTGLRPGVFKKVSDLQRVRHIQTANVNRRASIISSSSTSLIFARNGRGCFCMLTSFGSSRRS